jgi:hypothetical protein
MFPRKLSRIIPTNRASPPEALLHVFGHYPRNLNQRYYNPDNPRAPILPPCSFSLRDFLRQQADDLFPGYCRIRFLSPLSINGHRDSNTSEITYTIFKDHVSRALEFTGKPRHARLTRHTLPALFSLSNLWDLQGFCHRPAYIAWSILRLM